MSKISDRLKLLRDESGLSQAEFAEKMGVNRMTINNYETDKRTPDINFAIKAADYFGVTIEYISGKTEFRHREDMEVSVKKAEQLMKIISAMPQIEGQQMMDDLASLLELSNEYGTNMPILVGLINTISDYRRILSGYISIENSLVRTATELKRQKMPPALIQAACGDKSLALSDYVLDSSKTMLGTLQVCSDMLQKELQHTLKQKIEE